MCMSGICCCVVELDWLFNLNVYELKELLCEQPLATVINRCGGVGLPARGWTHFLKVAVFLLQESTRAVASSPHYLPYRNPPSTLVR